MASGEIRDIFDIGIQLTLTGKGRHKCRKVGVSTRTSSVRSWVISYMNRKAAGLGDLVRVDSPWTTPVNSVETNELGRTLFFHRSVAHERGILQAHSEFIVDTAEDGAMRG